MEHKSTFWHLLIEIFLTILVDFAQNFLSVDSSYGFKHKAYIELNKTSFKTFPTELTQPQFGDGF